MLALSLSLVCICCWKWKTNISINFPILIFTRFLAYLSHSRAHSGNLIRPQYYYWLCHKIMCYLKNILIIKTAQKEERDVILFHRFLLDFIMFFILISYTLNSSLLAHWNFLLFFFIFLLRSRVSNKMDEDKIEAYFGVFISRLLAP